MELTSTQRAQIQELGIAEEQIEQQLKFFKEGFPYVRLIRPATINDGIIKLSDDDLNSWIKMYDENYLNFNIVKFVPASGAASRMFKSLFDYWNTSTPNEDTEILLKNIEKFPFYDELYKLFFNQDKDLHAHLNLLGLPEIVRNILFEEGLNYGNLPKALLKFHNYPEGSRTALEEHLVEAFLFMLGAEGVRLHFTISKEHEKFYHAEINRLKQCYSNKNFDITFSYQKTSTNTIAVDLDNNPKLDENNNFIFRPGGHGALLENLNDIQADIIFIKNIDNIAPDRLKKVSVRYKKALGGFAIHLKRQITEFLTYLEWHDTYSQKRKQDIANFMEQYLGLKVPDNLDNSIFAGYVKSKLDKPIRICGMVKNTGEPGGGPYWVYNRKGEPTLQIIESSQVDMKNVQQKEIFIQATHFNPVDIVCIPTDYTGNKFNLLKYRDTNTGFISEKSYKGDKIKILELPGLWNGGMAHWITVFVEIPLETFTPVKSFTDWLREEHQLR